MIVLNSSFLNFKASSRFIILDVFRVLAILTVFLFHFSESRFPNGWIGVDLFFVISGYLVSVSFFSRLKNNLSIPYINFFFDFIRVRFLRIYTPFIFFIPFTALIIAATLDWSAKTNNFLYLSIANILLSSPFLLLRNKSYFEQDSIDLTYHLWSVSSELICYLVFPILALFALRLSKNRTNYLMPLILFFGISSSLILYYFSGDSYFNIGGHFFLFMIGVTGHILKRNSNFRFINEGLFTNARNLILTLVSSAYIFVSLTNVPITKYPDPVFIATFSFFAFLLLFIADYDYMGLNSCNSRPLFCQLFLFPGVYSLSFYLFHIPSLFLSRYFGYLWVLPWQVVFIIYSLLTFVLACASAFLFEYKIFLRFKSSHIFTYLSLSLFLGFSFISLSLYSFANRLWSSQIGNNIYSYAESCNRDYLLSSSVSSEPIDCLQSTNKMSDISRSLFIIGDSHADVLYNATNSIDYSSAIRLPLDRCNILDPTLRCTNLLSRSLELVRKRISSRDILLISFWLDNEYRDSGRLPVSSVDYLLQAISDSSINPSQIKFIFNKPQSSDFLNDSMCLANPFSLNSPRCQSKYPVNSALSYRRRSIIDKLRHSGFSVFDITDYLCKGRSNNLSCMHLYSDGNSFHPFNVDNHHLSAETATYFLKKFLGSP